MSIKQRYVALAKQSDITTPAVSGFKYIHALSSDLGLEKEQIYDEEAIGYIELSSVREAKRVVSGGLETNLNPMMMGEILNSFFGSATSTQQGNTTAYLHEFTPSSAATPYTIHVAKEDVVERFIGCAAKSLVFSFEAASSPTLKAEFIGRDLDTVAVQTPSYPDTRDWLPSEVSITIDGAPAHLKSLELTIENGMSEDEFVVGDTRLQRLTPGKYSVKGTLSARLLDSSRLSAFLSGSLTSLTIDLTGPEISGATGHSYQLRIELPRISYDSHSAEISARELLVEELEFTGMRSNTSPAVKISLKNTETGY